MAAQIKDKAVTSGTTYTWPDDDNSGVDISVYENHYICVTSAGAGVGTITADGGTSEYQAVEALTADDYNTYLLPNTVGIKIAATVADITVSIKSYNSTEK